MTNDEREFQVVSMPPAPKHTRRRYQFGDGELADYGKTNVRLRYLMTGTIGRMSDGSTTRRRWFQFSLVTMFLIV
jgi:hypothetical protein